MTIDLDSIEFWHPPIPLVETETHNNGRFEPPPVEWDFRSGENTMNPKASAINFNNPVSSISGTGSSRLQSPCYDPLDDLLMDFNPSHGSAFPPLGTNVSIGDGCWDTNYDLFESNVDLTLGSETMLFPGSQPRDEHYATTTAIADHDHGFWAGLHKIPSMSDRNRCGRPLPPDDHS